MKSVLTMTTEETRPGVDLPLTAKVLSGAVSAVACLLAIAQVNHVVGSHSVLVVLLYLQATLLALWAAGLAAATHDCLSHWEARVAPDRSRARVRADLLQALARTTALGLAGPLLLGAEAGWQSGDVQPLLGALAVLATAFCAAFSAVSAWQGRAPRWMLLPAMASLLVLLAVPGAIRALCHDGGVALLTVGFAGLLAWRCVLARQALAVCGSALPRPDLRLWWRRAGRRWTWQPVRYQQPWKTMGGETRQGNAWMLLGLMPQFIVQAQWLKWLAWGQAYSHRFAALAYAVWLMFLAAVAFGGLIAPKLHWRRRLAPHSMTPKRWARSLVLGSMVVGGIVFSVGLGMGMLVNGLTARPLNADAWLPLMGDVLLATSFGAWLRGRYERHSAAWMLLIGCGLLAAVALTVLSGLGVVPQRGSVWLLLQLALVLPLVRAAIRVWSQRDLNLMA